MRFIDEGGSGGSGTGKYLGELPRSESYNISERMGGLIRDCMVKIAQGGWILLLTAIGLVGGILTLWSLPSWVWFIAISAAYGAAVLVLPAIGLLAMAERRESWYSYIAVAVATAGVAWAAWAIFEQFLWDPLDDWTSTFFHFKVPIVNGWALVAGLFFVFAVLAVLLKTPGVAILTFVGVGSSCYLWLYTTEFVVPGLMFYLLLGAVDAAYGLAVFGIKPRGLEIRGTVGVLQWELADKYRPTIGGEETRQEPEVRTEYSVVPARGTAMGNTEEKQATALMPVLRSKKPRGGKNSEFVTTNLRMDEFCEALSHASIHGLKFRDMCFKMFCTGRTISQWGQWVELLDPLVAVNIYDRVNKTIHPDFDHNGRIDPGQVLDHLGLSQFEYLL